MNKDSKHTIKFLLGVSTCIQRLFRPELSATDRIFILDVNLLDISEKN